MQHVERGVVHPERRPIVKLAHGKRGGDRHMREVTPGTSTCESPMGAPSRSQDQMAASGSPERCKTVPTNSVRHVVESLCCSKTPGGITKTLSSSRLTAANDASSGGDLDGEDPQQPTKPRKSGEMAHALVSVSRTNAIVDQRSGQAGRRALGFRHPAVH